MILRLIVANQETVPNTQVPYVAYHTLDFSLGNSPEMNNLRRTALISAEFVDEPVPDTAEEHEHIAIHEVSDEVSE